MRARRSCSANDAHCRPGKEDKPLRIFKVTFERLSRRDMKAENSHSVIKMAAVKDGLGVRAAAGYCRYVGYNWPGH